MKTIHKIYSTAFLLAFLILTASFARAQDHHRHRGHQFNKEEHMAKMKEELGLTEQQAEQMKAIHEKYHAQFKALRSAEGEMDHEQMHALHQAKKAEIREVLTEEQFGKMKEMRGAGHHGRHGQHGPMHHRGRMGGEDMRPAHKEIHTYMMDNVMPVVRAQRAKLDEKMSAQDKATVEGLRAELKAMRPEMRRQREEIRDFRKEEQGPTDEQRAQMKAFREQRHEVMDKARAIAGKYRSELEALHAEVLPQVETWKADIQAIKAKYQTESPGEEGFQGHHKGQCEGKGDKAHCHRGKFGGGMSEHQMDPAHFILLDPNGKDFTGNSREKTTAGTGAETANTSKMDVFPNPSGTQNTLSYEVRQTGKVRIELLSSTGQVVRQLMHESRETGTHSLKVELSGLSSGLYYYRVTDADGARMKSFTVAK